MRSLALGLVMLVPVGGTAGPRESLVALQEAVSAAIATARPAVVSIRTRRRPGSDSAGAGVIVDPRGLVVTNAHVVTGAQRVNVTLWQRGAPTYAARVVARDEEQDLAVLALPGPGPFAAASPGDSEALRVGDRVVAVGTPLGYAHSASLGIVSDLGRTLRVGDVVYADMIQTDATINQGNSGGPLLNLRGEVVGLVTAIFSPEGGATGVAFAIPSSRVLAYLRHAGRVAGVRAVGLDLEPIRIGQRRPHPFTGVCTVCHTIAKRLPIKADRPRPHPYVGSCNGCHIMTAPAAPDAAVAGFALPAADGYSPVAMAVLNERLKPVWWVALAATVVIAIAIWRRRGRRQETS